MVDDEVLDGDAVRGGRRSTVKVDVVGHNPTKPRPHFSMQSVRPALDELEMVGAGRGSSVGLHVIKLQTVDEPLPWHGDLWGSGGREDERGGRRSQA
jgi:hypothetical protein